MTIIEAMRSGKPFRRRGEEDWYMTSAEWFTKHDILSDDWEIKDEPLRVEFECANWQAHVCGGSGAEGCIFYYPLLPPGVSTKQFNGKRTRVTIEELRDE